MRARAQLRPARLKPTPDASLDVRVADAGDLPFEGGSAGLLASRPMAVRGATRYRPTSSRVAEAANRWLKDGAASGLPAHR